MAVPEATRTKAPAGATRSGRLFLLELSGDRIHSMNVDGSDRKTIGSDCHFPDGVVVAANAGHIYWTDMGEGPRLAGADSGSAKKAHRQHPCRGRIAHHRGAGGGAGMVADALNPRCLVILRRVR